MCLYLGGVTETVTVGMAVMNGIALMLLVVAPLCNFLVPMGNVFSDDGLVMEIMIVETGVMNIPVVRYFKNSFLRFQSECCNNKHMRLYSLAHNSTGCPRKSVKVQAISKNVCVKIIKQKTTLYSSNKATFSQCRHNLTMKLKWLRICLPLT